MLTKILPRWGRWAAAGGSEGERRAGNKPPCAALCSAPPPVGEILTDNTNAVRPSNLPLAASVLNRLEQSALAGGAVLGLAANICFVGFNHGLIAAAQRGRIGGGPLPSFDRLRMSGGEDLLRPAKPTSAHRKSGLANVLVVATLISVGVSCAVHKGTDMRTTATIAALACSLLALAGCKQETNYPAADTAVIAVPAESSTTVVPVPGPTSTEVVAVPVPGPTSTTVIQVPGPTVTTTATPTPE